MDSILPASSSDQEIRGMLGATRSEVCESIDRPTGGEVPPLLNPRLISKFDFSAM